MKNFKLKILQIEDIIHDVRAYRLEKPAGYKFIPGQATDVAINRPGFIDQKRPFTFTSLNEWDFLEFIIKSYNDHNGITKEFGRLTTGAELIINEPWGSINYKGVGYFIAGGAGVTPFIAILRDLYNKKQLHSNKLIFANKTESDIILRDEFAKILGPNFVNILSVSTSDTYPSGFLTTNFLKANVDNIEKYFYVCGPPPMMESLDSILAEMGVINNYIIKEKY